MEESIAVDVGDLKKFIDFLADPLFTKMSHSNSLPTSIADAINRVQQANIASQLTSSQSEPSSTLPVSTKKSTGKSKATTLSSINNITNSDDDDYDYNMGEQSKMRQQLIQIP